MTIPFPVCLRKACVATACIQAVCIQAAPAYPLHAAPPNPVHWAVAHLPPKPVAPGAVFSLVVSAQIEPGWHLYALEEPDGGPVPTQIGVAQGDSLTLLDVTEPVPSKVPDPATHTLTALFQGAVAFTLKLRAPQAKLEAEAVSHILVRYQTCNDQVCLPPRTETLSLPLSGVVRK